MSEPATTTNRLLMTERQAAEAMGVCPRTLANLVRARKLTCVKIGRAKRYDVRDLTAYIDRQKQAVA